MEALQGQKRGREPEEGGNREDENTRRQRIGAWNAQASDPLDVALEDVWRHIFSYVCTIDAVSAARFSHVNRTFNAITKQEKWSLVGSVMRIHDPWDVPMAWKIERVQGREILLAPLWTELLIGDPTDGLPVGFKRARVSSIPDRARSSVSIPDGHDAKMSTEDRGGTALLIVDSDGLLRCHYKRYDLVEQTPPQSTWNVYSDSLWSAVTERLLSDRDKELNLYLRIDDINKMPNPRYSPIE